MRGKAIRLGLAAATVLAASAAAAPGASAGSLLGGLLPSCGAESTPFAQWGNFDSYCAFPNLGFESGTAGWTLTGNATVVSGSEPSNVSGPGDPRPLTRSGRDRAQLAVKISALDLWLRLFARNGAADGPLSVRVEFQGPLGNLAGVLNVGTLPIADYASWQPTQRVLSVLAVPLGTTSARVFLESEQAHGSWLVDDFYLDPCVSRVR